MYIGSTIILMCFKGGGSSIYTVLLSFFFALAIWLNQYTFLKALKFGPMSFTTFIQGGSLIIPIIFGAIVWSERKVKSSFSIKSSAIFQAAFSGAFMGTVHIINLYLSGALPKVIFFPVANIGLIFVTSLSDLIFFKERLNLKQWIGIIIGTAALCIIGL